MEHKREVVLKAEHIKTYFPIKGFAGQTIGNVGKTAAGEAHDKAWIHLAVEKDGKAVDPKPYLKAKQ